MNFRAEPDLEFEGLLKRQHTRIKYFQGSLMSAIDLERAQVKNQAIAHGHSSWDLVKRVEKYAKGIVLYPI